MKSIPLIPPGLAALTIGLFTLAVSTTPARSENVGEDFLAALAEPLKKEFGRAVEAKIYHDKKIAVVRTFGIRLSLKADEIDREWGARIVRAAKAAGAAAAEITITKDIGPAEVRAREWKVGKFTIPEVQFVARPGEENIEVSFGVVGG